MHQRRFTVVYFIGLLMFQPGPLQSQDLMPGKGNIRTSAGFFFTSFNEVFDMDGERKPSPETVHSGFEWMTEAGLHERWSILLNLPFIYNRVNDRTSNGDRDFKSQGRFGDVEAGIKFGLPLSSSLTSCIGLYQSFGNAYRDNYYFLNTGYADFNTKVYYDLEYRSKGKWSLYGRAGFNHRNKGFSDEVHAAFGIKLFLLDHLNLDIHTSGISPLENGSHDQKVYQLGLYHNNSGVLRAGLGIRYQKVKGAGCFAKVDIPLKGQYIYGSPVFNAGLLFNLSIPSHTGNSTGDKKSGDEGN
ncbi:MAG: hypothetical protein JNL88_01030 [Bacteroidia bacterium]|nr:hypothetical protein [Bacteroidia bacterium]